ncbi:universal stress protein [Salinibacter sp. 10B]|uniref:universal stress protein n=1 Tax=Salinibacter sp. 10B TaxID=1923971 RepID=UPI000CF43AAE|nr:universal stress protein [Salinibacter sp. 10B]PQJ35224.1 universal stress protein [Salinibacter sp. 10B]
MIQDILFAHDFSPSSKRALPYAADLARRTGATLHLMYVKEVPLGPLVKGEPSPIAGENELRKTLRNQLKDRCQDLLEAHLPSGDEDRLHYHAERSGAVAPALVRYAKQEDIDLVVMGTQGQRGLQEAFVGSVAREVLRTAPCPVFTTRVLEDAATAEESSVNRIVVPIDFSDPSREALRYAGQMASIYETPIKLVHVVESPKLPSVYGIESPKISERKVEAQTERALAEWADELPGRHGPTSYIVQRGDPASLILNAASSVDDLIVMATHGRSGLRRAMLGSVAEEVVAQARGPVLTGRTFPAGS